MRILITGSNGVVGKGIAQVLGKDKKYKLVLLTNKKVKKSKKKFKLFYQDLTKNIDHKFKVDAIIHCASKNPLSKNCSNSRKLYLTNLKMTKNLIKFSNENCVDKIIFLSSVKTYGEIKRKNVTENLYPKNLDFYGKSKLHSEKNFSEKSNKFKTISLRLPGVLDLSLSRNQPLIINIIKKIMNNKNIYAYNTSCKFNNIIDIYELVKLIKIILRKKKIRTCAYNFAASCPISFISVLSLIKKMFKSKSKIINKNSNKTSFTISNKKIIKNFNIKISTTKNIILRNCRRIKNINYKVA